MPLAGPTSTETAQARAIERLIEFSEDYRRAKRNLVLLTTATFVVSLSTLYPAATELPQVSSSIVSGVGLPREVVAFLCWLSAVYFLVEFWKQSRNVRILNSSISRADDFGRTAQALERSIIALETWASGIDAHDETAQSIYDEARRQNSTLRTHLDKLIASISSRNAQMKLRFDDVASVLGQASGADIKTIDDENYISLANASWFAKTFELSKEVRSWANVLAMSPSFEDGHPFYADDNRDIAIRTVSRPEIETANNAIVELRRITHNMNVLSGGIDLFERRYFWVYEVGFTLAYFGTTSAVFWWASGLKHVTERVMPALSNAVILL